MIEVGAPQELVELALGASHADGCIVLVAEHSEANLRWAANSLTTNGQMRRRAVTVISVHDSPEGTRAGVLTRSIATAEEIVPLVRAAERAAAQTPPSDDAAPLVESYPNQDDWSGEPGRADIAEFDGFAAQLGPTLRQWDAAGRLLFGFAEFGVTSFFLGTSTGLRRRFDQPTGRLELNGKSGDYRDSVWAGAPAERFASIDLAGLIDQLRTRLDWSGRRLDLPAGHYETLLPPTAVADLMIYAYWNASARDAEEGRNVFSAADGSTRLGQVLTDLALTLRSDPAYPGLRCAPFQIVTASDGALQSVFDNGAPLPATNWVDAGRLAALARTRSWARRTGQPAQALIDNLILEAPGADGDLESMIAGTERGLLLTSLWYIREVDPQSLLLTGLTRDGVFLVENDRVIGAVNNFRFNESPVDLLGRVTEVGRTELTLPREWSDYFTRAAMPPIRVSGFNMSTVSPAS